MATDTTEALSARAVQLTRMLPEARAGLEYLARLLARDPALRISPENRTNYEQARIAHRYARLRQQVVAVVELILEARQAAGLEPNRSRRQPDLWNVDEEDEPEETPPLNGSHLPQDERPGE